MAGPRQGHQRELFYWLALSMAHGVGPVAFARLLRHYQSPEAVFRASAEELSRFPRLSRKTIDEITNFDWAPRVENQLKKVREKGLTLVTLNDPRYPSRLKEIHSPPSILWAAGDFQTEDAAAVAIVGSRGATDYGREHSGRLARELAGAGVTVVSGMAMGIDAAAHRGALEAGGRTIGVLGCGLDVIYPRVNRDLFEKVPRSGVLLSEYPLGTEPQPGFFPVRNRIIAGLSVAVVVVEAAERSGALITADLALEQNREVLALPGRVGSIKSRGTHALLRQGARLVESAADILEEIGPQLGARPASAAKKEEPADLTPKEKQVWDALGAEPLHVDQLSRQAGLTPAGLAPVLLELEIRSLVKQLPGMRYIRII